METFWTWELFCKNRCDKVSKMEFMSWLTFSIFRALRCGVLFVYYSLLYVGAFFVVRSPICSFSKNWKSLKTFCENLCDKVSKMIIMSWLYFSIFRAFCCVILHFYHSLLHVCAFLGLILPIFSFSNKLKISQNVMRKSLWQSFENEKYELTVF